MTHRRRGFTLIELLVVMGIMVLLIAILLPAVSRAHRNAVRASMMGDLIILSQGLESYKDNFGDYPRTGKASNGTLVTGAATLCWALVAPGPQSQDGNDGPGFRLRGGQGRVYGPYVSLDHFSIGTANASGIVTPIPSGTAINDATTVLADRYGHVILYFPGRTSVSPSTGGQLVGAYGIGTTPPTPSVYNFNDNAPYLPTPSQGVNELSQKMFAYKMGNVSTSMVSKPTDTPIKVPYILWCAGPDGIFGPQATTTSGKQVTTGEDDDVIFPDLALMVPAKQLP